MAGLSSRFKNAGYTLPKYMLTAHGKSLFMHSVESFKKYFDKKTFLFIAIDSVETSEFIKNECEKLGIKKYKIVLLEFATDGQAETVYKGLKLAEINQNESITIFNIDTFRPGFSYPDVFDINEIDGYLETFIGSGSNWSNIKPKDAKLQSVEITAEKKEISNYCCTGLYYWSSVKDYLRVFEKYRANPIEKLDGNEFYIAPMYNYMIKDGKDIRYNVIENNEVIFCGVPDEYEDFIENKKVN